MQRFVLLCCALSFCLFAYETNLLVVEKHMCDKVFMCCQALYLRCSCRKQKLSARQLIAHVNIPLACVWVNLVQLIYAWRLNFRRLLNSCLSTSRAASWVAPRSEDWQLAQSSRPGPVFSQYAAPR